MRIRVRGVVSDQVLGRKGRMVVVTPRHNRGIECAFQQRYFRGQGRCKRRSVGIPRPPATNICLAIDNSTASLASTRRSAGHQECLLARDDFRSVCDCLMGTVYACGEWFNQSLYCSSVRIILAFVATSFANDSQ